MNFFLSEKGRNILVVGANKKKKKRKKKKHVNVDVVGLQWTERVDNGKDHLSIVWCLKYKRDNNKTRLSLDTDSEYEAKQSIIITKQ